jgi:hypothetical protein
MSWNVLQKTLTVTLLSVTGRFANSPLLRVMVMCAGVPVNNIVYDCKPKQDGSFDASAWFYVHWSTFCTLSMVRQLCPRPTRGWLSFDANLVSGGKHVMKFVPASSWCVS